MLLDPLSTSGAYWSCVGLEACAAAKPGVTRATKATLSTAAANVRRKVIAMFLITVLLPRS